ncbi:MAG TPA: hypothetical protein PLX89_24355 [Verrucomicrobiota bacterium]|nr:hypothetical protein [Verrucomicrobiales bacterium]HRI16143.1 hypothetical protein [Verrucomicrobiota bacterium]
MAAKEPKVPRRISKGPDHSYYLTGESVLRASASPYPPRSKTPTLIRFTHSNCYGPVDADIFVRIGDPKSPLGHLDFNTVSDWRKAKLVAETVLDYETEEWIPRPPKIIGEMSWEATYEAELQFAPGKHLIEIKFMSSIEAVCSLVLSNWEVRVK